MGKENSCCYRRRLSYPYGSRCEKQSQSGVDDQGGEFDGGGVVFDVCLSITPDVLLGNASQASSRTRQFRSLLHIKKEDIAVAIDMSVSRLEEIEAGESMTNAELRDLAVYLGTSTHCILAQNVFYPQTTALSDFVGEISENSAELSGFWGHLGIMPSNSTEYIWYPITSYEAGELHYSLKRERAVVPCMDNKLLYLNLEKIKSVVLLDEACDAPAYYNWDPSVGEGEIPLVVYEVVGEYLCDKAEEDDEWDSSVNDCGSAGNDRGAVVNCIGSAGNGEMVDAEYSLEQRENSETGDKEYSAKLRKLLDKMIGEKGWTEDVVHRMVSGIRIRYTDGSVKENDIDFNTGAWGGLTVGAELVEAVDELYMSGGIGKIERFLGFTDYNGAVTYVNTDEVAVIEMPLIGVEREIMGRLKEIKQL